MLAIGIPFSAVSEVLAGILRRDGRTSTVAVRTAIGQLSGMAVGLVAIFATRTAWSLGVSSVAGLALTTAIVGVALPRGRLTPVRPTTASLEDARYGIKSAGMNVLRYSATIAPGWSIGRFAGADSLGTYNRATTMLTVPLESLQRAFSYTLFPELRRGGPLSRGSSAFTDLMILVSWAAITLGGIGFFAAEPFLSVLLGSQWRSIGVVAGVAWLLGIVPMIGVPLGSIIEARGHFRISWLAWALGTPAIIIGIVLTSRTASPVPAALGLLGYTSVLAAVHLVGCVTLGYIAGARFLRALLPAVLLQTAVTVLILGFAALYGPFGDLEALALVAIAGGVELLAIWISRRWIAVGHIAAARGVPGFASTSSPGGDRQRFLPES